MKLVRIVISAAAIAAAAPAFAAQRANRPVTTPNAAADPAQADAGAMTPGEIQRMFDAWTLVEAQAALQLSDAQYSRFVPKVKALHDARRNHQQARQRILAELRKLTNGQGAPDEPAVAQRLQQLRDEDERAFTDVRKALAGVDEVLDTARQARFRLFEERMETRKLELLTRARANARLRRGGR